MLRRTHYGSGRVPLAFRGGLTRASLAECRRAGKRCDSTSRCNRTGDGYEDVWWRLLERAVVEMEMEGVVKMGEVCGRCVLTSAGPACQAVIVADHLFHPPARRCLRPET